jgi:hypothetical protein
MTGREMGVHFVYGEQVEMVKISSKPWTQKHENAYTAWLM